MLTRVVTPAAISRTNTSSAPLVSPATRLGRPTRRPRSARPPRSRGSALPRSPVASAPDGPTLTRVVTPVRRSYRKTSRPRRNRIAGTRASEREATMNGRRPRAPGGSGTPCRGRWSPRRPGCARRGARSSRAAWRSPEPHTKPHAPRRRWPRRRMGTGHAAAHPPQWAGSVARFTHASPQRARPSAQGTTASAGSSYVATSRRGRRRPRRAGRRARRLRRAAQALRRARRASGAMSRPASTGGATGPQATRPAQTTRAARSPVRIGDEHSNRPGVDRRRFSAKGTCSATRLRGRRRALRDRRGRPGVGLRRHRSSDRLPRRGGPGGSPPAVPLRREARPARATPRPQPPRRSEPASGVLILDHGGGSPRRRSPSLQRPEALTTPLPR